MKKILSFILACSMILSLGFNVHIHAESEDNQSSSQQTQAQSDSQQTQAQDGGSVQPVQSGINYELKISNQAVNLQTKKAIVATVTVDNNPLLEDFPYAKAGQKVVIKVEGMTPGRKIGWVSQRSFVQENDPQKDFNEAIFEVGDGSTSTGKKTMREITNSSEAVNVVSFVMPDTNLKIIIKELNDKIRFYDEISSSNINIESAPQYLSTKEKFTVKSKPHNVSGMTRTPIQDLNYEVYDNTKLSYKDGFFTPKILGLKPDSDDLPATRTLILAKDNEGNVGAYGVDIKYTFQNIVTKDLDIKIYDHDGTEQSPKKESESGDKVTYAIADKDRVKITAKDMNDRELLGWEVIKGDRTTTLDVIEMGTSGEEVHSKEMSRYNQKSVTFIFGNTVKEIRPIYKEANKYQITVDQTAENKANIVIQPQNNNLDAQTPVTIIAMAKDASKKVKALLYNYNNEGKKIDYKEGGITIAMPAFDMTITDVELEDKASSNPPSQNPPSSDNNSDSGSSSGSGSGSSSNAGSGSGSSVERISPTPKKENPIKDSKKSEDEKKDLNKAPQVQKPDGQSPQTPNTSDTENMIEKVFGDVKSDDWFAKSVAFVKEYDLMRGTGEKMFSPNEKTSRAMLITILHRLSGSVQVEKKMQFEDVKADAYYVNALDWAIQNEIVKGFEDGTFRGDDVITREQVALMLFQYAKAQKKDISKRENLMKFTDENQISSYAHEALQWAHAQGLILGKGGNLDPKGNATRAEIATVIMRFIEQFQKQ